MRTSRQRRAEGRGEIGAEERERWPSAKDLGSARWFFRSSKLYLRTALTNYFNTTPLRLLAQNDDCFEMKRLRKHVYKMQLCDCVTGLDE